MRSDYLLRGLTYFSRILFLYAFLAESFASVNPCVQGFTDENIKNVALAISYFVQLILAEFFSDFVEQR